MIREFRPEDIKEIERIYEKFYKNEFPLPDFLDKFICAFSVLDENDKLVLSGGVRPILEAVAITDKDNPVRLRRHSLYELLQACSYVSHNEGYDEIHATVINDPKWENQLRKVGFRDIRGTMLVLNGDNNGKG